MKKLVLVIVWILLIAVFIVLNYLLWDRDNKQEDIRSLETLNASNNSSINALGREINKLESDKKKMEIALYDAERDLNALQDKNKELDKQNQINLDIIKQKNVIIYKLMEKQDLKDIEASIKKWVNYIDNAKYTEAYELIRFNPLNSITSMNLEQFTENYKKSVKNMSIKSIEFFGEKLPEGKRQDIVFRVVLDIKKIEGIDTSIAQFTEGENERYFTMDYSSENNQWVISGIFIYY